MNSRRPFLFGFALGLLLATVSSYYHFCKPQQTQALTTLTLPDSYAAR